MTVFRGDVRGEGRRFAIVQSRFNDLVTDRLLAGASSCLQAHGVAEADIDVLTVPGAFELPYAAMLAALRGGYDGIIALGCVIRGDTPHFDFVAGPAADGLARVALEVRIPVAFGVLTTDTPEQALERCGGKHGNKGWEAALTVLEMADLGARVWSSRAQT